jgi:sugar phosphate isomerase/epimerase
MAAPGKAKLGIATTCYMTFRKPKDTLEFLEYANSLGAAGIQSSLSSLDDAYVKKVRARAEQLGMYVEIMCGLPRTDLDGFTRTLEAAKKVGALCARSACLSGRRYETFATLDDWKKFVVDSKAAIARAVPVADKLQMPFAIENHKDWTVDELTAILKGYSSEYFGVCLDTGNNISLLDDPMETVERLAPYALSTHIKDMGVAVGNNGFLLSEVVFGQGFQNIRAIVDTIQRARPKTKLTLEMITRNPLHVPCMTDKYWTTFPERNGVYLARTFRLVNQKQSTLPTVDGLSPAAQLQLEEDNVKKCLAWLT